MTAPLITHLARSLKLQVDSAYPGSATPSWIDVKGISTMQSAIAPTLQSTNDYDSDGWNDSTKTMLGWSFSLTLMRKGADEASFDPGQQVLEAAHDKFGDDGVAHIRWYDRNGATGEAYEGYAEVGWAPAGGAPDALNTVAVTLTGKGARTAITNPAAVPAVPRVASLSPASGAAAGGSLVTIIGDNFTGTTGATGVKFGATNATNYSVVNDERIVATAPANTTGAKQVVVTNAAGPSTDVVNFTYV